LEEPDFNTPDFVKVAASTKHSKIFSLIYTPVNGYLDDVRQAIAEKFKIEGQFNWEIHG